jgi:hypothetical protein
MYFSLKPRWYIHSLEHASGHADDSLISPLHHSILLRRVGISEVARRFVICAQITELLLCEFTTMIGLQRLRSRSLDSILAAVVK